MLDSFRLHHCDNSKSVYRDLLTRMMQLYLCIFILNLHLCCCYMELLLAAPCDPAGLSLSGRSTIGCRTISSREYS